MTFLELCQFVREQADMNGTGPTTVVGQTGDMALVVRWTAQAWADIERLHTDWNFLRMPLSFTTTASQVEYTLAQMNASDLEKLDKDSLRIYLTSTADEQFLVPWGWQDFYDTYLYGSQTNGRPTVFSVNPKNKGLNLGSIPDATYTVRGWYYRRPALPTADADEPAWPSDMHEIVVYRALLKYANFDAAPEVRAAAAEEYSKLLVRLERDQLPELCLGEPLA